MTRKSCAVGMRNAILRNHLNICRAGAKMQIVKSLNIGCRHIDTINCSLLGLVFGLVMRDFTVLVVAVVSAAALTSLIIFSSD